MEKVQLPYYFKCDTSENGNKTIMFGKKIKTPEGYCEIIIREHIFEDDFEGEIHMFIISKDPLSDLYYDDLSISTKEEFEAIKERALKFLNEI